MWCCWLVCQKDTPWLNCPLCACSQHSRAVSVDVRLGGAGFAAAKEGAAVCRQSVSHMPAAVDALCRHGISCPKVANAKGMRQTCSWLNSRFQWHRVNHITLAMLITYQQQRISFHKLACDHGALLLCRSSHLQIAFINEVPLFYQDRDGHWFPTLRVLHQYPGDDSCSRYH